MWRNASIAAAKAVSEHYDDKDDEIGGRWQCKETTACKQPKLCWTLRNKKSLRITKWTHVKSSCVKENGNHQPIFHLRAQHFSCFLVFVAIPTNLQIRQCLFLRLPFLNSYSNSHFLQKFPSFCVSTQHFFRS